MPMILFDMYRPGRTCLVAACAVLFASHTATAQVDSTDRPFNDEVGIDVTAFLRQFLHWASADQIPQAANAYLLSYRHFFGPATLRAGLGFNTYRDVGNIVYSDERPTVAERTTWDGRIGVEKGEGLGRRWQFFYGVDLRYALDRNIADPGYYNAGYAWSRRSEAETIGVAPLCGIRFRINKRFSLLTETSAFYGVTNTTVKEWSTPIIEGYPPHDGSTSSSRTVTSSVNVPFFVVAAITL